MYRFDISGRFVYHASTSDVPWPVLFLLGFRHRRHRFISGKLPRVHQLSEALQDACHKLRWRHFFADAPQEASGPRGRVRFRKRVTPFLKASGSSELDKFCEDLHRSFVGAALRAFSKAKGRYKAWSNVWPIERAAHAWLAESPLCPVPTDKDGGYCLISIDDLRVLQLELLQCAWYDEIDPSFVSSQMWKNSYVPIYRRFAAEISKIDDRVTTGGLCHSLTGGPNRMRSYMIHTVKTHKPAGSVRLRPVHSSSNHAFGGIMSWIALVLNDSLKKFSHIIGSSDEFVEHWRRFKPSKDMVFLHWDIKDFFMQGTPEFLVKHASLILPRHYRDVFRKSLLFILKNQFVSSRLFPGRLWRVKTGSGMGLKCSSAVAEAAFLHAVELMGVSLALSNTKRVAGIQFYKRYRDNLLFCFSPNFIKIKNILKHLEERSAPYTGEVEEASLAGVQFLDMNIHYDMKHLQVHWSPNLKPVALKSVLSIHSAHPVGVHSAWLKAYFFRVFRRCSSVAWFQSFKDEIMTRLAKAGVDHAMLSVLDRQTVFTYPVPVKVPRQIVKPHKSLWITIPFHPVWHRAFNTSCREMSQNLSQLTVSGLDELDFRIAWSLSSPVLSSIIAKF